MFYICFNIVCRGVVSNFHKTKGEEVETPKLKYCICIKKGSKGRVYIGNIVTSRPRVYFEAYFCCFVPVFEKVKNICIFSSNLYGKQ